jgi:hypothetical protein
VVRVEPLHTSPCDDAHGERRVRTLSVDQRDQATRKIDDTQDGRGSDVTDLPPRGALSGLPQAALLAVRHPRAGLNMPSHRATSLSYESNVSRWSGKRSRSASVKRARACASGAVMRSRTGGTGRG